MSAASPGSWRVRALAPLALMAAIFWMSSQTGGGDLPEWVRKVAHFTEYALLASLWLWALAPRLGRSAYGVAAAVSVLYAISDEFHQSFVPGRLADPLDALVDALGVVVALGVAYLYARGRSSTRPIHSHSSG